MPQTHDPSITTTPQVEKENTSYSAINDLISEAQVSVW